MVIVKSLEEHSSLILSFLSTKKGVIMLLVELVFSHRILRKIFHRPTHGRLWCGKIYLGEKTRLPLVGSYLSVLPWKKSILVFIKAQTKARIQSLCFR